MSENTSRLREQSEIVERINGLTLDNDWLGFRREVLMPALDFRHAKPFLKEFVTEDAWIGPKSALKLEREARDYYQFALGKVEDHRGISARRSVDKLREFAWLLSRDDVVEAMDAVEYPRYGAPKLFVWAWGFGEKYPLSVPMVSMAKGKPCTPRCDMGCHE